MPEATIAIVVATMTAIRSGNVAVAATGPKAAATNAADSSGKLLPILYAIKNAATGNRSNSSFTSWQPDVKLLRAPILRLRCST